MNKNFIETIIGLLVIALAITFFSFAYKVAGVKKLDHAYQVRAAFDQVEGVIIGSDVMVSGIKVGTVSDLKLNTDNYNAEMFISIRDEYKLPIDSSARIVSSGLLGGKYVELQAGADEEMLKEGDTIQYTQSSVNLETLLGKFMFNSSGGSEKAK